MNVVNKHNLAAYIDTIKNAQVREAVSACWLGTNDSTFRGIKLELHPLAKELLEQGFDINTEYLRFVPHVSNVRAGMMAHAPNKKMLLREGEPLFSRTTPAAVLSMLFPRVPALELHKLFTRWSFRQIAPNMSIDRDSSSLSFTEHGSTRFRITIHTPCENKYHVSIKALTPEYLDVAKRVVKRVVKTELSGSQVQKECLGIEVEIVNRVN